MTQLMWIDRSWQGPHIITHHNIKGQQTMKKKLWHI